MNESFGQALRISILSRAESIPGSSLVATVIVIALVLLLVSLTHSLLLHSTETGADRMKYVLVSGGE